jgi:sugar lactone lactonase YvrE
MTEQQTDAAFELLVDGVDFGEGPRWRDGTLWYSDFYQQCVYRVTPDGVRTTVVELDDRPSGLGWLPSGDLLIVAMISRRVLRYDGSKVTEHADISALTVDKCNDMIVDASGNAYVGHFGFDLEAGADFKTSSVILVRPDGTAQVAADEIAFPNGSVITDDGTTLIVGQSFGGSYVAFDIADDATLSNRREWAAIPDTAPDGCAQDSEGAIWFSDATGSQVVRVLEGGQVTHRIATPQPTYACELGGPTGHTLFVLTSPSADPRDVAGKGAGAIYTLNVEVPGI